MITFSERHSQLLLITFWKHCWQDMHLCKYMSWDAVSCSLYACRMLTFPFLNTVLILHKRVKQTQHIWGKQWWVPNLWSSLIPSLVMWLAGPISLLHCLFAFHRSCQDLETLLKKFCTVALAECFRDAALHYPHVWKGVEGVLKDWVEARHGRRWVSNTTSWSRESVDEEAERAFCCFGNVKALRCGCGRGGPLGEV